MTPISQNAILSTEPSICVLHPHRSERKHKRSSKTSSRKVSTGKAKTKKITIPNKSKTTPKKTPNKSSSKRSKVDDDNGSNPKVFSRKEKNEVAKEKASTPARSASRVKFGKRVAKGKDKVKAEKLKPNDDEFFWVLMLMLGFGVLVHLLLWFSGF